VRVRLLKITFLTSIGTYVRYNSTRRNTTVTSTSNSTNPRDNLSPIQSRIRSIDQHHFQWPWTIPNPDFKVTLIFDAKYISNGRRQRHIYNERRIGTRMRFIEWCHFQWPWVTPNLGLKVTIFWMSDNWRRV